MPRGYLKHNKGISKKKGRGGSSSRGCIAEKDRGAPREPSAIEDFVLRKPSTKSKPSPKVKNYPIGECPICFNEAPVICLSKKCEWHEAACRQCLHRIYVSKAQQSHKAYPLRCFHPLCDQSVHAGHLENHGIFVSPGEVKKHHEMLILSRIKKEGMLTVHCPKCDTPRGIRKLGDKDKTFGCNNPDCNSVYSVSPCYATIRALESMKSDSFGINDGWARCPHCNILISKGDGCEHMECIYCENEFDWDEAQRIKESVPHARVPDAEIYRWW